jgi:hypothetical protein
VSEWNFGKGPKNQETNNRSDAEKEPITYFTNTAKFRLIKPDATAHNDKRMKAIRDYWCQYCHASEQDPAHPRNLVTYRVTM